MILKPTRSTVRTPCMHVLFILALLICVSSHAHANNLLVKGSMDSQISFEIVKNIQAADSAKSFFLSYVVPKSYQSPTFSQNISNFSLQFTPQPTARNTSTDRRGNEIVEARWDTPPSTISAQVRFTAATTTQLQTLHSTAPFPMRPVQGEPAEYLAGSALVQTADSRIITLAQKLTDAAVTQYDAVQQISAWIVDNVRYVNPPEQFDALYSLTSGKGNCQNYSHLAAALMRVVGIPVRVVNGLTVDEPFDITLVSNVIRSRMGLGRHSWIEVWFPDLGWVPFNPQNTALFIANRFIRVEVGLDNKETISDGKIKWMTIPGNSRRPAMQENINSDFGNDTIALFGNESSEGPLRRLMLPVVESGAQKSGSQKPSVTKPPSPVQPKPAPAQLAPSKHVPSKQASPKKSKTKKAGLLVYGNLEFPENVDFATYATAPTQKDGMVTVTRNFMVETAEYVTTHLRQYAQLFELDRPIALKDISLALHRYGGDGMLWIDLMEDAGEKPGELIATSDFIPATAISLKPGYRWISFSFKPADTLLKPGKYWIGLGYTGDPILNWYYTYGKPVGPPDGTRFRDAFVTNWSGALSYEFNYRVRGTLR